jgi:dephospho-CoA kinase
MNFELLTGGIGSGKSTVAKMLEAWGIPIISADEIARKVVQSGTPAHKAVLGMFGHDPATPEGRRALRNEVLTDPDKKGILESFIFPEVVEMTWKIRTQLQRKGVQLAVYESAILADPALFKKHPCLNDFQHLFSGIILVDAPEDIRASRVAYRDGISLEEALALVKTQQVDLKSAFPELGFELIDAGGSEEKTRKRVEIFCKFWAPIEREYTSSEKEKSQAEIAEAWENFQIAESKAMAKAAAAKCVFDYRYTHEVKDGSRLDGHLQLLLENADIEKRKAFQEEDVLQKVWATLSAKHFQKYGDPES